MARSPFTLAAAVTAASPGAEVTGARALTAGGDGRFDSAVATIADGRELAIRVADDDETSRELAAEALALRALTPGARAMLPFDAPEYVGETRIGDAHALVTELLPGFQIEAGHIPGGRGAAESIGASIAALHALPGSVVRSAGLTERNAAEAREEIRQLVDRAAATGRVPARLTVRWREAVDDEELWRFESAVTLGGAQATSFLFADDPDRGPHVTGVLHWHGLSIGDPAIDLAWLSAAPDAAGDVHAAYAVTSDRAPDPALVVRARLLAELEFARWLVHGEALRRADIIEDAAGLLASLAEGLREDDLTVIASRTDAVEQALDAMGRVPATATTGASIAMETDAYRPEDLLPAGSDDTGELPGAATEDLSEIAASGLLRDDAGAEQVRGRDDARDTGTDAGRAEGTADAGRADGAADTGRRDRRADAALDAPGTDETEAQRAARAALQRWTSSSSE